MIVYLLDVGCMEDANVRGAGEPSGAGQPAAGGVADLQQRLPGGDEAGRDAAAGVHARQAASRDGTQLRR